jgi:hypothetical protein
MATLECEIGTSSTTKKKKKKKNPSTKAGIGRPFTVQNAMGFTSFPLFIGGVLFFFLCIIYKTKQKKRKRE